MQGGGDYGGKPPLKKKNHLFPQLEGAPGGANGGSGAAPPAARSVGPGPEGKPPCAQCGHDRNGVRCGNRADRVVNNGGEPLPMCSVHYKLPGVLD